MYPVYCSLHFEGNGLLRYGGVISLNSELIIVRLGCKIKKNAKIPAMQ